MRKLYNMGWILFLMLPILSFSQTYQLQWGKQAGGLTGSADPGFNYSFDESIRDIVVDDNNNTYYLATMNAQEQNLNGVAVANYGLSDLFLFSTDCAGNVRWSRAIGGSGNNEHAWQIALDNNGGLYIMATFYNSAEISDPNGVPIHFDETHIIPPFTYVDQTTVDSNLKSAYLLKYNTSDGKLAWSKSLQGDVSLLTRNCDVQMMYMDSSKNIHAVMGFRAGTHLNGLITVPSTYTSLFQYYLVKFNYDNGNMTPTAPLLLPIDGSLGNGLYNGKTSLLYDESLNRYYLAGTRYTGGTLEPLSYNNIPFTRSAYVLAFNGGTGLEVWRKELNSGYSYPDEELHSLIKDPGSSDIYISGHYFNALTAPSTFGNYTFTPRSYYETIPFVMKLNEAGIVQWVSAPDGMSNNFGFRFSKGKIALNGNEIGFAKGSRSDIWGNFAMIRPNADMADPLMVRLNKNTGAVIGTKEIHSNYGIWDEFTAIAVDKDGNYILGGFFHNQLFTDPSDGLSIMTNNVAGVKSQSFFTKYAKSACSQMSVVEISASQAGIQFYPNPVQDILYIKSKEPLVSYELYGATGQSVRQGALSTMQGQVTLSSLPTGTYYIKLTTKSSAVTEKIMKK
ncbi:T9SS type A sorting domain-containing protein [Chryseobacterium sp. M5A1_1a]